MRDWKAVRLRPGAPQEICDLKSDPGETNNVADGNEIAAAEQYLKTADRISALVPLRVEAK
jgi:hypothetical protein